ncbi:antitoxin Xre/MbcA/ParS toxin-binding domain-containing protein [Variovorax guangxiensis]|uniref:6-hydroxy-3-succinoylpyridine 3-monooxygenase n=1 Tax=Variovorax guangxiensis TaxID=1775474 RepID=A0A840FSB5_9BURK|nr:antitoxin Xre/MbcA/ParS toxin-binding domain-containing protein [Variovorax guangxiensis]MBB4225506.1 6-hydroxy-3-succinoylpyridine 3-monooxygenase [Variovorax guangxiensis]
MGSQPADPSAPLRTRIYIDGYNLYYGALKGTPYKWLDLLTLFERHVLPSSAPGPRETELLPLAIKFFTAEILEKVAKTPDSKSSQARYHTALTKLYSDRIDCIKGYYSLIESKAKIVDAEDPKKWPRDCQEILVWKVEEKQSDVNLALQAYHDAMTDEVDQIVVVTNDTDIAPALAMIRQHTPAIIGVVIPTTDHERIPNTGLAKVAHWVRTHITADELRASQLPRVIGTKRPTFKPDSWYARPDLLEKVLTLATPIRGSRGSAFKWMEEANPYLDGAAPIDLVETEAGAQRVLDYIDQYVRDHLQAPPGKL